MRRAGALVCRAEADSAGYKHLNINSIADVEHLQYTVDGARIKKTSAEGGWCRVGEVGQPWKVCVPNLAWYGLFLQYRGVR